MTRCFVFKTPVPYPDAVAAMEERIVRIRDGRAENALWFLEHPDVYTAGINAVSRLFRTKTFFADSP